MQRSHFVIVMRYVAQFGMGCLYKAPSPSPSPSPPSPSLLSHHHYYHTITITTITPSYHTITTITPSLLSHHHHHHYHTITITTITPSYHHTITTITPSLLTSSSVVVVITLASIFALSFTRSDNCSSMVCSGRS